MKFQSHHAVIGVAAALPLMLSTAHAQDTVQVYGLIDTSIQSVNNQAKGAGTLTSVSSGDQAGSRIGFKGSEDLGNGKKAIFVLESGFDSSNGNQGQSRFIGRQAFVGLSDKSLGQLTLGRQATLMVDWMSKYNAFGSSVFSVKQLDSAFSDRSDNTIKYIKKLNGVTLGGYYSKSWNDTAGKEDLARLFGFGANYESGNFSTGLLYHKKHANSPAAGASEKNQESRVVWGTKYKQGSVTWTGGYRWLKQELTKESMTSHLVWAGLNYKLSAPTTLSAAVYHVKGIVCDNINAVSCPAKQFAGSDRKATMITVGSEYAFSKRTALYGMAAYAINDDHSSQSVIGGKYGVNVDPGKNQVGVSVGLRHTF